MGGAQWAAWNRKMRDMLVRSQARDPEYCDCGSWAPERDAWGSHGGRVMTTSLSALTLEIYYRYSPLYDAENADGKGASLDTEGNADTFVPTRGTDAKPGKSAKKPAGKKAKSDE